MSPDALPWFVAFCTMTGFCGFLLGLLMHSYRIVKQLLECVDWYAARYRFPRERVKYEP